MESNNHQDTNLEIITDLREIIEHILTRNPAICLITDEQIIYKKLSDESIWNDEEDTIIARLIENINSKRLLGQRETKKDNCVILKFYEEINELENGDMTLSISREKPVSNFQIAGLLILLEEIRKSAYIDTVATHGPNLWGTPIRVISLQTIIDILQFYSPPYHINYIDRVENIIGISLENIFKSSESPNIKRLLAIKQ